MSAGSSGPAGYDADPNAAKLLELYPPLPAPITDANTYEILRYYLPGGYEWASLYAWAHMNLYRHGFGWPKGNTDWGKHHSDPHERAYEGLPDPVRPGYGGNAIARTLTGSGPLSWSLNGKESGIWDLVGNCWEWCDLLVGTTADHTIDAEYPGAGTKLPSATGYVTSLYALAPEGEYSLAPRCSPRQRSGRRKRTMAGRTTCRKEVSVPWYGAGISTLAPTARWSL